MQWKIAGECNQNGCRNPSQRESDCQLITSDIDEL